MTHATSSTTEDWAEVASETKHPCFGAWSREFQHRQIRQLLDLHGEGLEERVIVAAGLQTSLCKGVSQELRSCQLTRCSNVTAHESGVG